MNIDEFHYVALLYLHVRHCKNVTTQKQTALRYCTLKLKQQIQQYRTYMRVDRETRINVRKSNTKRLQNDGL